MSDPPATPAAASSSAMARVPEYAGHNDSWQEDVDVAFGRVALGGRTWTGQKRGTTKTSFVAEGAHSVGPMSTPTGDPYWNSWRNTDAKRLLRPDGAKGAKALAAHMSDAGAIVVNLVPLSGDEMRSLSEGLRRVRGMTCIRLVREARGGGLPVRVTKALESRDLVSVVSAKARASSHTPGATANRSHEDVLPLLGQRVAEHVSRSKSLLEIEIGVDFGPAVMGKLGHAIASSESLRRVSFRDSEMGDASFSSLVDGIRKNDALREIDLSGCALTDTSDAAVASVVRARAGRRAVEAWETNLRRYSPSPGKGGGRNAEAGKKSSFSSTEPETPHLGLARLELSYNDFTSTTVETLCHALRQDNELAHLGLRGNRLSDQDASRLGKAMRTHGTLSTISLCQSRLGGADLGVLKATERLAGVDLVAGVGNNSAKDSPVSTSCEKNTEKDKNARETKKDVYMDMEWVPSSPRARREAVQKQVARKAQRDQLKPPPGVRPGTARPGSGRFAKQLEMTTRRTWTPASGATANRWNDLGTHSSSARPQSALPQSPFFTDTKRVTLEAPPRKDANAKEDASAKPASLRAQAAATALTARAASRGAPWTKPTLGRSKADVVLSVKGINATNNSKYSLHKPTPASASSEKTLVRQLTKALRFLERADSTKIDPMELRRRVAVAARAAATAGELADCAEGDDFGGTKSARIMAKVRADMRALADVCT